MKLWTLVENTSCNENLKNEHGLSFYIETQKHKILFDFGQSDIFLENATKLGIDLSKVDIAILSHGHYDHGGGLKKFLQINSFAKIYINKNAFNLHYNGTEKYIGLDLSLKDNERFIFIDDELIIDEELSLYSCNNAQKTFPINPYGLKVREENNFIDEDFIHEQYLLIEENNSNKKRCNFILQQNYISLTLIYIILYFFIVYDKITVTSKGGALYEWRSNTKGYGNC